MAFAATASDRAATSAALAVAVTGAPKQPIAAAATKSPRGRTPMMRRVLMLITRPLMLRGTRVCRSVIIVALTPT